MAREPHVCRFLDTSQVLGLVLGAFLNVLSIHSSEQFINSDFIMNFSFHKFANLVWKSLVVLFSWENVGGKMLRNQKQDPQMKHTV